MIKTPTPVTVTTSGDLICQDPFSGAQRPGTVLVRNTSATTVYIGGGYTDANNQEVIEVTSSNGMPLDEDEVISLDLAQGESIYGITASGTATVRILYTNG